MTVRQMFHLLYFDSDNLEGARKALRIPAMSPGWRGSFEQIVGVVSEAPSPDADCCSGR
ncbi:MAG: 3-alpha domain-containing protein [Acidobacteriota bacterium]